MGPARSSSSACSSARSWGCCPSARGAPFPLDGSLGEFHHFGDLADGQSAEKPELHDPRLGRVELLELFQGVIESEKIGVRIEDDVLITDGGRRVLSSDIPKSAEAIEAFMASRS